MVLFVSIFILFFGISFMLSSFSNRYTGAYLTDSETLEGNVFRAVTWSSQAEDLKVDLKNADFAFSWKRGLEIENIILSNTGNEDINLTKIKINIERAYVNSDVEIDNIDFDGTTYGENGITPYILELSENNQILEPTGDYELRIDFDFPAPIKSNVNLSFMMGDGSNSGYEVPVNPKNISLIDTPYYQGPNTTITVVKWTEGSVILNKIMAIVEVPGNSSYVEEAEFFINEKGENGEGHKLIPIERRGNEAVVAWYSEEGLESNSPCAIYAHGKDSMGNWGSFDSITINKNNTQNETEDTNETSSNDSNSDTAYSSSGSPSTNDEETVDNTTINETQTNRTNNTLLENTTINTTSNTTNGTVSGNTTLNGSTDIIENTTDNTTNVTVNNTTANTTIEINQTDAESKGNITINETESNRSSETNTTLDLSQTEENSTGENQTYINTTESTGNQTYAETTNTTHTEQTNQTVDSTEEDNTTETYNETDITDNTTNDDNENNTTGSNTTEYNQTDGDETS
ncbi:MAG: hypothetical protein ABEK17_03695 [Candidatus Aenigmatarchaeota archaeon]